MSDLEYRTVEVRSSFAPRWWELRRRFRWWRIEREERRRREALSPVARALEDEITRRFDEAFLGVQDDG